MKIVNYLQGNLSRVGVVEDGNLVDLSEPFSRYGLRVDSLDSMLELGLFDKIDDALSEAMHYANKINKNSQYSVRVAVGAAGEETCGFAVIIGKKGKYIKKTEAMDHVLGFTVADDVSFRDLQFPSGWPNVLNPYGQNWVKGKSLDYAFPLGPWVITADEIDDPYSLNIRTTVNGEVKQDGNTSDMIFSIEELIEYASNGITLMPGDVISTGTPHGVAAFNQERFLSEGDIVEVTVSKVGYIRNRVKKEQ